MNYEQHKAECREYQRRRRASDPAYREQCRLSSLAYARRVRATPEGRAKARQVARDSARRCRARARAAAAGPEGVRGRGAA